MAENQDILEMPEVEEPQGPGPQQPALRQGQKDTLVKLITNMQKGGESDENIKSAVKRYLEVSNQPTPSPIDKGLQQTSNKMNEGLQFNGTFQPDLEGEKKGLYLNDPDYQRQKQDFVGRIMRDDKGRLLYPEQDDKGNWSNYYTKEPIPGFDPAQMEGKILQTPHEGIKQGIPQFITPKKNQRTGQVEFKQIATPTVPTVQDLPTATVYGTKKGQSTPFELTGAAKLIGEESKKQGGQFEEVVKAHPELQKDIQETLAKYGAPYIQSLTSGSQGMMNVLRKTVEDKAGLNEPIPKDINPDILNGHLNVLNNLDQNRRQFEDKQDQLQRQADLIIDHSKRTGQPIDQLALDALVKKHTDNVNQWNNYSKAVNFAQNYVNQPSVKQYLTSLQQKKKGLDLLDEISQRSFPNDTEAQIKQDEYDRKAIEGNLNAWDYIKTFAGRAASGLANVGETGAKALVGPTGVSIYGDLEKLNNNAQQFIGKNLPQLSPEGIKGMLKGGHGMSVLANDIAATLGSFAPYLLPGLAEEGLPTKLATAATALAESAPQVRKEAQDLGLTGKAYDTYLTAKPLVDAAFMTLLPNAKFAKGYEENIAKSIVNGESSNVKRMLLNAAAKSFKDPSDVIHLQAMLSGTVAGDAVVNGITNKLQAAEDLKRGIVRKDSPLSTDISGIFDPRKTAVMALAGKIMEAIPTIGKGISNMKYADVAKAYQNSETNLVELAATNLTGVSDKVNELLKKDPGNIYAQHIKNTLEDFSRAELQMPSGLEPEQKAALYDIQKKVNQLKEKQSSSGADYKDHLDKNIEELNKQIPAILKDAKAANKYLQESHDDFINNIQSPQTEENGKETQQAEGRNEIAQPEGGATTTSTQPSAPSTVEKDPNFRTLDYGDNKGKDENAEAQEKIKQEIINDEPIGKTGERFSQFVGRIIPAIQYAMEAEPHNTAVVTHSSVIKALRVWEEMGRPDVNSINMPEFAKRYTELQPEAEGKVHTFKGDNGNDIKVVRHGETEDNKLSEFRQDDTALTEKGVNQAWKAGDNLVKETGGSIPKIISSDLPRTLHTSDIIKQKLTDHAVQIESTNGVHEREQGENGGTGSERGRMEPSQQGQEPPREGGAASEKNEAPGEKETIGTKRSINDVLRQRMGLSEIPIPKLGSDTVEMEGAKLRVDSGKSNPLDIVSKILETPDVKDIGLSTNERYDMQYHMLQLKQRGMELSRAMGEVEDKLNNDPADEKAQEQFVLLTQQRAQHADDYIRAADANRIGSAVWGQSGNAMQVELDENGKTLQRIQRIQDWYGGNIPPEVKTKLEEVQKKLDDANAKMEKLQADYDAKVLENENLKAQKTAAKKPRKSSEQFKAERKEIVSDLKDALKKARGNLSATIVPVQELAAITPHLLKLFKSYAEEGLNKVEDVVGKMFEEVKEHVPGITQQDIKDVLAGKYKESKKPIEKNEEYVKAQQAKANATLMLRKLEKEAMDSKKNKFMKGLDFATQWERRIIFAFNNAVFVKLGSAALLGSAVHKPIEVGIGRLAAKALPKIAENAPIEGSENLQTLGRFYGEFFNPIKFAKETWQIYKRGESHLTQELSTKGHVGYTFDKKIDYLKPVLDVYTNTHQVIKDPVKRAVFESSMLGVLQWYRTHGLDPSHPLIMEEARQYAYKRAEYEIFQNKSGIAGWFSKNIKQLENSAMEDVQKNKWYGQVQGSLKYTVSTLYHMLVPVATVPINITARAAAGLRLPDTIWRAFQMEKGIREMQPEQADIVLKQLKKGAVGAAYWTLGLFLAGNAGGLWNKYDPDKSKNRDLKPDRAHANQLEVAGMDIPKEIQHTPQLQALQYGATLGNVYGHYIDKMKASEVEALGAGMMAQIEAMTEGVPPLKETTQLIEGLAGDQYKLKKTGEDIKRGFGVTRMQDAGILPKEPEKPKGHGRRPHR